MTETSEEQDQNSESATKSSLPLEGEKEHHARGLLAIGLFKLCKALFFLAVGAGALHLVHRDIGDLLLRVSTMLRHFDPEGRFFGIIEDKADLINGHQLRNVVKLSWGYAALSMVEGVGLMLEKTWAEYLTLTLTIGALPWDLTELVKHPNVIRAGIVLINLIVLAYLLWFLRGHRQHKRERAAKNQAGHNA
jgi:uncharacterized membrane protein (DUF2068 family)